MTSQTLVANTAAKSAANTGAAAILRASQSGASVKITAPASEVAALSAADARLAAAPRGQWYVLAASAVKVDKTGDTNETALATITIPAGSMGANGILRVTTLWSHTNNANTKTWRLRLGGISGTQFASIARTTTATDNDMRIIQNRNSQSSQVSFPATQGVGFGTSTGTPTTGTIDTSAARDLVLSAQLGVGTDTMSLERYIVELLYQA